MWFKLMVRAYGCVWCTAPHLWHIPTCNGLCMVQAGSWTKFPLLGNQTQLPRLKAVKQMVMQLGCVPGWCGQGLNQGPHVRWNPELQVMASWGCDAIAGNSGFHQYLLLIQSIQAVVLSYLVCHRRATWIWAAMRVDSLYRRPLGESNSP